VGFVRMLKFFGRRCCCLEKLYLRVSRRGKHGASVGSVPLKRLVKLSRYGKKRWELVDDWLILEAY